MKRFRWLFFLLLWVLQGVFSSVGGGAEPSRVPTAASSQEKGARVAIVIGNSKYPSSALTNPKNDATAMAASLKKLGFDVELKLDATKADTDGLLRRFSAKAEKAAVAAVFYAGHGIQVGGSNYLVPVDANPQSERDLKRDLVKMDDVIDDMGDAKVKLVFFDACRDNPLSRSFRRSGAGGMAAPTEATGTLISFATKHGNTAADGEGKHSPYTTALLAELEKPNGVEIEQLLRRVQQGVKQTTRGQQEPWRYGSLDGDFYFRPADLTDTAKAQQEVVDRAVADAVRRANEQAAKERAELQLSMEKMLKEALAKQNAALEAERAARLAASGATALPPAGVASPAKSTTEHPIQLASIAPTAIPSGMNSKPSNHSLSMLANTTGDEWEYKSTDRMFGKHGKLVLRVKAATSAGVIEELRWNDASVFEWVFDGKATALGTPNEAEFLFAPHWDGVGSLDQVRVEGGRSVCTRLDISCTLNLKVAGTEKLTIPAGTFDAVRLEGWLMLASRSGSGSAKVTIWYSMEHRRLLKQVGEKFNGNIKYNEVLELTAIRHAPR